MPVIRQYTIESATDVGFQHDSTLLGVDNRDVLSVHYGEAAHESFYLQSPNGTIFLVTINGVTGAITVTGGIDELTFGEGSNFQLALMGSGLPWVPNLPMLPVSLDVFDQWQLLWGIPFDFEPGEALSGTPIDKYIVDFDGDVFKLTVSNDGVLHFSDDWEVHTAPSDIATPAYTEE